MFGHQDEDNATTDQPGSTGTVSGSFVNDTSSSTDWMAPPPNTTAPAIVSSNDQSTSLLETDASDSQTPSPINSNEPAATASPVSTPTPDPTPTVPSNDLLDIKQQALQQLSPLVGQLDQSPEEKFRTTMMMIQASDNQSLLKDAFTAAQQISDDKQRAQALLDVINEINYFTQQQAG